MSANDFASPMRPNFVEGVPQPLTLRHTWLCCLLLYVYCIILAIAAVIVHFVNANVDLSFVQAWYWLILPVLFLLTIYTVISSRAKAYLLREHDMSFYRGVIFKSITVQPLTRLQHIEITRGPLERLFGLATLKLFSAGGAQHAMAIPGLLLAEAEDLRGRILDSKGLTYEQ